jgi:hypothetical protein
MGIRYSARIDLASLLEESVIEAWVGNTRFQGRQAEVLGICFNSLLLLFSSLLFSSLLW